MNQDYSFITDNLTYSYSSLSSFETCRHMFYLTYIERKNREQNAFADFGSFIHKICEEYFGGNLEIEDMVEYYEKNYSASVITPFPPFPKGMAENYYNSGLDFFAKFPSYNIRRENYEILGIEDSFNTSFDDISLIIKPDLVLRNKKTQKVTLLDYKSSKKDDKKLVGYKHQLHMYAYFLWQEKQVEVDNIKVWFIREKEIYDIPNNPFEIQETLEWMKDVRNRISEETGWEPNLKKENEFFCRNICSTRLECKFRNGSMET
jgi:CRISPR/Cas system-associated exonuclease Cas4 (RecB family)